LTYQFESACPPKETPILVALNKKVSSRIELSENFEKEEVPDENAASLAFAKF
jgi:hypothetical protein